MNKFSRLICLILNILVVITPFALPLSGLNKVKAQTNQSICTESFTQTQSIGLYGTMNSQWFTLNNETYLAVANYNPGSSSKIYKWNGSQLVEFQSISTLQATDLEFFAIDGSYFIAVANSRSGSTYNVNSQILKWNGSSFIDFQSIPTNSARDWEYFKIGNDHYLVVANYFNNSSYGVTSRVYKWNGTQFLETASIGSTGAFAWESFEINNIKYLAVANYRDSARYSINSTIYKWDGSQFLAFQQIPTSGAYDVKFFTINNNIYLAYSNEYDSVSRIYKWNGTDFQEFQSLTSEYAGKIDIFNISTVTYLSIANQVTNGKVNIYKWENNFFNKITDLATTNNSITRGASYSKVGTNNLIAIMDYQSALIYKMTACEPPQINLTSPGSSNVTADKSFSIAWTDSDADSSATISLYYGVTKDDFNSGSLIVDGLQEDDNTNSYTWDTSLIPVGRYYIYARITDGTSTVYDFSDAYISISHNSPPVFRQIPGQTITQGSTFAPINLNNYATDLDPLTYTFSGNKSIGITITQGIANLTYQPGWTGSEIITFNATDTFGKSAATTAVFKVLTNPTNQPPVFMPIPIQQIVKGETFNKINLDAYVSDTDANESFTFSFSGSKNISVNILTATARFSYPTTWSGEETIIFTVKDSANNTASTSVKFQVLSTNFNFQITKPLVASEQGNTSYNITWSSSVVPNSQVALYFDTDNFGEDGTLIADNISATNSNGSYLWETSNTTKGTYYIYGVMKNNDSFGVDYSSGTISIQNEIATTGNPGTIEGGFEVDQSGAAQYVIPLKVTPGTAEMEPQISLAYNSRNPNSTLGLGWNIDGLTAITRCPTTLEQDGFIDEVDFDANDKFCISGSRLIAINGNYGAEGTEYRTELESFTKIISHGNADGAPTSFEVWNRDGTKVDYGNTSDSRIEASGRSSVLVWAVNKITDTLTNYISYSYEEDNSLGDFRISKISYTGNINAGLQPYNFINFEYEDRADIVPAYINKSKVQIIKRIKNIKNYNSISLVKEYRFTYEYSESPQRTRVKNITLCGFDGKCLNPTVFDWEAQNPFGMAVSTTPVIPNGTSLPSGGDMQFGDWNGDGKVDALYYNNLTGANYWYINGISQPKVNIIDTSLIDYIQGDWYTYTGDWNGDGLTDVLFYNTFYGANYWYTSDGVLNTAQIVNAETVPLEQRLETKGKIIENPISYSAMALSDSRNLHDFNGDGRTDIMWFNSRYGMNYWYRNDGSLSFTTKANMISIEAIDKGGYVQFGDWNGDGIKDVVWHHNASGDGRNYWYVLDSEMNLNTIAVNAISRDAVDSGGVFYVGDFNSDKLDDVIWYRNSDGANRWYMNTGYANFSAVNNAISPDAIDSGGLLSTGDWNGDGMLDVMWYDNDDGRNRWYINSGTLGFLSFSEKISKDAIDGGGKLYTGDWDGDGISDAMWHNSSNGTNYWYKNLSTPPNKLIKISNGLGIYYKIEHKSIVDSSVYTKGNSSVYPLMDIQIPFYVVNAFSTNDGIGGDYRTEYKYSGAKFHHRGYGFLGFATISSVDKQTNITTVLSYLQDYPFTLKISKSQIFTSDQKLLSKIENTWNAKELNPKSKFVFLTQTLEEKHELDESLISKNTDNFTYDNYGNLLTQTSTSMDGYTITKTRFYEQNINKWILELNTQTTTSYKLNTLAAIENKEIFTYNKSTGQLISATREPNTTLSQTLLYEYDVFGNTTRETQSGYNLPSRFSNSYYDSQGRFLINFINEMGHSETYQTDSVLGLVTKYTNPNGLITQTEYDSFGRIIKEIAADGTQNAIYYSLCDIGCPTGAVYWVKTKSSGLAIQTNYFDNLQRNIRTENINLNKKKIFVDNSYNKLLQLEKTSDPYFQNDTVQWTTIKYDGIGREIQRTLPGNRNYYINYKALTTEFKNPLNQIQTTTVNSMGWLLMSKDNQNNSVKYEYDSLGNPTKVLDAANNATVIQYDNLGRKLSLKEPNNSSTSYSYDAFDRLITVTNAKKQTTTVTYDNLDRVIQKVSPEGGFSWIYDFGNKAIGKISRVEVKGYSELYSYDDLGRLKDKTIKIGQDQYSTGTTYDAYSRVSKLIYPSGFVTQNIYGELGDLVSVIDPEKKQAYWKVISTNAISQLQKQILGNNVEINNTYSATTNMLQGIQTKELASQSYNIQNNTYTFDEIGNLKQRKDLINNLTEDFSYDDINRLVRVANQNNQTSIQYNAIGNITSKSDVGTYTYGQNNAGPNAVTSIIGAKTNSYTYDANGNRISSLTGIINYTSFDKPNEIIDNATQIQFKYAPDLSYYQQIVRTQNISGFSTITYINDLFEKQIIGNNIKETNYIKAGNITVGAVITGKVLSNGTTISVQNKTLYFHTDHLGSIEAITDGAGKVVERQNYSAFGERRNGTTWQNANLITSGLANKGFTGHNQLDSVGLIHMGGRVYDPVIGRFVSADPFVQSETSTQSHNRYSYALNNPLSYTDPSGYFFKALWNKIIKPIVAAIVGITVTAISGGNAALGALAAGFVTAGLGIAINQKFNWKNTLIDFASGALIGYGAGSASLAAAGLANPAAAAEMGSQPLAHVLTAGASTASGKVLSNAEFDENLGDLPAGTLRARISTTVSAPDAKENGFLSALHSSLDLAGFIPGLGAAPDLVNAGIYAVEGKWWDAGFSALSAIPAYGDAIGLAAKGGKYTSKGLGFLSKLESLSTRIPTRHLDDVLKRIGKFKSTSKKMAEYRIKGGKELSDKIFNKYSKSINIESALDKTGGGHQFRGKLYNGDTIIHRVKPDGTARIHTPGHKFIFEL